LTTAELIPVLVGLKFRIVRSGGRFTNVLLGLAVLGTFAAVLVAGSFVLFLRNVPERADIIVPVLTAIGIAWFGVPVVLGGGEGTLHAGKLTVYPIETKKLVIGLMAAAFVGVPALATGLLAFTTISHARSATTFILLLVSIVVFAATAVLSGRTSIAIMSGLLRGRRTKELAGALAATLGVSLGVIGPFATEYSDGLVGDRLAGVRGVAPYIPWGWPAEAIGRASLGDVRGALFFLVLALVFAAGLWTVWSRIMERMLTDRAFNDEQDVGVGLIPRWMTVFGSGPIVAVWARSLRQLRRDPREFMEIAGFLPMIIIFTLPSIEGLRQGEPVAVLGSGSVGLALGITSLNMFGADARSFGVDALASTNIRHVLVGKVMARLTLGVPLILVLACSFAAIADGWAYVFPSLGIGLTSLLSMAGVGMFVSTRFPFALPDTLTLGGRGSNGCATGVIRLGALLTAMVAAAPGVAITVVVTLFVSPGAGNVAALFAVFFGLFVFWGASRISGRWATNHIPEVFQLLSAA